MLKSYMKSTKLPVFKTLSEGFELLKNYPIIFVPVFISTVASFLTPDDFLISIASALVQGFLYLVTIVMTWQALTKRKILIGDAAELSLKRVPQVILGTILFFIAIVAGFIALIIPGIFLSIKLVFFQYFILFENVGVMDSFKKSWKATDKNWWRMFALNLLLVISFIPAGVISLPVAFVSSIVSIMLLSVLTTVVSAWYTTSLVVAYKKLR